jgi:hypothetical protein
MASVVRLRQTGNFHKTESLLSGMVGAHYMRKLRKFGRMGVEALREATPRDTGKTAESWSYEIVQEKGRTSIYWKNSNIVNGVCIAVILHYGHGTRGGGFVEGKNYITPAIQPILDRMADEVWKEVVL